VRVLEEEDDLLAFRPDKLVQFLQTVSEIAFAASPGQSNLEDFVPRGDWEFFVLRKISNGSGAFPHPLEPGFLKD
jgi:hypothetical protein